MLGLLFAIGLVLLASALCSGTEAALFSIPLVKARELAQAKQPAAVALLSIRNNMSRPIATVVILNNIANIVGSIVVGSIAATVLGKQWLGLFSGILTFLVIICAEIIPKTLGESYAETIALRVARPVSLLTWTLTPLVWSIEQITLLFTPDENQFTTNESEIKLLAHIGHKEGVIEKDESEMIQRIFELNDLTSDDLMTPRVAMTYLKGETTLAEVKDQIMTSQHSRIVVVKDTPDDVLGVAFKDELLGAMVQDKETQPVADFVHDVRFVPETMQADKLLAMFQQMHRHLAVVVDEYGGVSGVITLEDVLEVLTGEIVDETDKIADLQEFAKKRRQKILEKVEQLEEQEKGS